MKINDTIKSSTTTSVFTKTDKNVGKLSDKKIALDSIPAQIPSVKTESVPGNTVVLPFNAKKVEDIKTAIASGLFKVDPDKIADELINSVKQLMQPKK
jgi:negative regulator of flagellin synthesis FlgM